MPVPPAPSALSHGLYVHVPFCARKCSYCAFYSEASDGDTIQRYVNALLREMELAADAPHPGTIFFGGGTPTLLSLQQWSAITSAMHRLQLAPAPEWTVECNPATLSADKARLLRDAGVNRVSMGVQSLDEALLDRLGRVHSRDMVFRSFDILRKAGFDNLNLDLMFAIPGQSLDTWNRTLDEALAMGSEHLSTYEVIYEDDTPLFHQLQAGEFDVDEDLACAMYDAFVDRVTAAGFVQYEVANFARDGRTPAETAAPQNLPPATFNLQPPAFACRHNINYWRGGDFEGLGPSATSYLRGVRSKNISNTQLYCAQIEAGRRPVESREELAPLARAGETAAFGLRMVGGWPFEDFRSITGHDLRREWSDAMQDLARRGWGRIDPDRFRLTREGLRFADAAAEMFLR
ncbi:MAG: radical SAM family heme chaperone HemW [Verrucomicrobiota bacterium]